MFQTTLRVTLKNMSILQSPNKYHKATVKLKTTNTSVSLSNPRFVKNNEVKFYSQKLYINIQFPDQSAVIQIYGLKSQRRQLIGEVLIVPSQITEEQFVWKHNNSAFNLEYETCLLYNYRHFLDEEQTDQENLMRDFNIPNFLQCFETKSVLQPKRFYNSQNVRSWTQRDHFIETKSDSSREESLASYQKENRKSKWLINKQQYSFDSWRLTDAADYNLIEPITHFSSKLPLLSQGIKKKQQLIRDDEISQELRKSRCYISQIKIPITTLLQYIGISFVGFVLGTIAKQGLPF